MIVFVGVDQITKRPKSITLEAETFEDERIVAAIDSAAQQSGSMTVENDEQIITYVFGIKP